MSPELMTVVLFASMLLGLVLGLPISFVLGGVAIVFTYFLWGQDAIYMVATNASGLQLFVVIVCAPMFIFMGYALDKAGVADALFETLYQWLGFLRGGLAMGSVLMCTIFAAMVASGIATVTVGLIALPAMLKRNYHKNIAVGSIMAGGALGILIPPSIPMILFAVMAQMSVGRLFVAGIIPGLMLSSLFIIYISIRCRLQPHLGPPVPLEEKASWQQKFALLRGVILPILLIVAVLGSIFFGVCSPAEAAAVGAFGSLICAAVHRRLSWRFIIDVCVPTFRLSAMVMWIFLGAKCFTAVYAALGGQQMVGNLIASLEVNRWVILIAMQISYFFLGMFLNDTGIIMLTVPVYMPIVLYLGFDPLWFGILFVVNMEMAFLTPPFGFNIFYMKGIVPKEITIGDIYRCVIPFVAIQMIGLALVMLFPQLALWLPSLMIK